MHIEVEPSEARINALEKSGALNQLKRLIKDAQALAGGQGSFDDKAEGILTLADRISKTLTPHLACAKGCNHCCYMAVAISDWEADMIGRYIGRNKVDVAGTNVLDFSRAETVDRFTGARCPMLGQDGKCTVYPVRPVACRTHHNLAVDETNCIISGVDRTGPLLSTPAINLDAFLLQHAFVFYQHRFADIREWFPDTQQQS